RAEDDLDHHCQNGAPGGLVHRRFFVTGVRIESKHPCAARRSLDTGEGEDHADECHPVLEQSATGRNGMKLVQMGHAERNQTRDDENSGYRQSDGETARMPRAEEVDHTYREDGRDSPFLGVVVTKAEIMEPVQATER